MSAPLRQLLKDDVTWQWTPAQETAWMELKEMVVKTPVLAYYSQRAATIVSGDASSFGIGAVLMQLQEDGRRAPISYISRALTSTEQNYSQIEKEALAMTWACEKFHCYLFGSEEPFVIETDHKPLVSIMNVQNLDECPPRLMRLKLRLMRYSFQVQYVPGKHLLVADALSRAPVDQGDSTVEKVVQEHVATITELCPESDTQLQEIREATLQDPQLAVLLNVLQTSWPTRQKLQKEIQQFWPYQHLLTQVQGLVLRGVQIVIPRSLRKKMLARAHEGHQGIAKTKARLRETMWWPGMSNEVEQVITGCDVCARYRHQQRKEPLTSTPLPQLPWEQVAMDLFEWKGEHFLLVIDYYSRFPEVRKLSKMRTANVIQALRAIFSCHGIPSDVFSDNGPQFASAEFREFAATYGFCHRTSSPCHPQGNGLVERGVQTIKSLMTKARFSGEDFYLGLLAYRTTPHETTGVSPAHMLMGRRLRTTLPSHPAVLAPELVSRETAQVKDEHSKQQQSKYYNNRNGARQLRQLNVNDRVLVWDSETQTWRIPAVVIQQHHGRSFRVRLVNGTVLRRNRHQLQWRPGASEEDSMSVEEGEEADKATAREEDRAQYGGIESETSEVPATDQQKDTEVPRDYQHSQRITTRSGRSVQVPVWRKDYV
jgi:transposase InsO family protein